MKIKKVLDKSLQIKVPPNSRIPIETSENLFSHHGIVLAIGKRQSGKSVFLTNYLRLLKQEDKCDRILVISPTILSNKALLDSLDVQEQDCFDPEDKQVVGKIMDIVDSERDEWEDYERKEKRYQELHKLLHQDNINIRNIDPYLLMELTDAEGNLIKPVSKYGHFPIIHVFVDDCQSSPLFRDKKFLNLAIRHRHLGGLKKGGALGVSLYIAIQNLTAQSGGCPRAVRNNCTQMVLVGKCKDKKELEDIYKSVAGEVSYDDFTRGYEYCSKEPHNSFVIDLHPKKPHQRFRKNMDEYLEFQKIE